MIRRVSYFAILHAVALVAGGLHDTTLAQEADRRPNIVIILADDMGFADMGSFGSEIPTPNLDALAQNGVRFTQFYTHATCSPTRSMLLSGVDNHLNGLGNMSEMTAPNQKGVPGYEGTLNHQIAMLPELLNSAGYQTYMVGKWHMGKQPDKIPRARGFDRDFALLDGGGSYWDMTNLTARNPNSLFTEDGLYLNELPKDYYATRTYTDKMITFIDEGRASGKPFFAYVSHQAPHDPYHLPRKWRDKHVGEYDMGWDITRQKRLARQVELGIMPEGTPLAERLWFMPMALDLAPAARAVMGRKMELYAGMVENLDFHVGRLVQHLKEIGEYENTLFLVFGDNGPEGSDLLQMLTGTPGTLNYLFAAINWSQTDFKAWGDPGSFVGYGPGWAQVSTTPFAQYKGMTAEGGLRNALIVSGPGIALEKGSIHHRSVMHVADIMPTLLEVAGAVYPETLEGRRLPPLFGKSWVPMLAGEVDVVRSDEDYLAWEIFANRALRQGHWKIRWQWKPFGTEEWELFDLAGDPAELHDRASSHPEKLASMLELWEEYVEANNVIIPSRAIFEAVDDSLPQRFPYAPGYPPIMTQRQYEPPADLFKESNK